jgi:methionyl-tRNA formyltransferase
MKIAFFGSPHLCLSFLEKMKEESLCPSLVVTNPDKPVGRKQTITPTPVKKWAEENKIEVLTPEKITPDFISVFKEKNMDLSVVIAYGKILPEELINIPKYGTINVHFSLLPRHRGATPVEATILSGDTEAGVTIQQMVFELDAGDVLNEEKIEIKNDDTKESLFNSLSEIGSSLLIQTIQNISEGKSEKKPQDNTLATFSKRIKKSDGEITDVDTEEMRWRKYRAYTPWPRTFFFKNGKRFVITEAVFENSKFEIKKVIPEGGKEIPYSENL